MTPTEFKTRYPLFSTAPDDLITAIIAEKELQVSDSWGDRRDAYLALNVADAVCRFPEARQSRLIDKKGETPFSLDMKKMELAHAFAFQRLA